MPHIPLADIKDRRLDPYRSLKFDSEVRRARLFVAEGDQLVQRLLASDLHVHSVLLGEHFAASRGISIPENVTTFLVPDALIPELAGFKFHRGVLACGYRAPDRCLLDVLPEPAATCALIVVCIDIHDPTNLGSILRTAHCFGVSAVILGGHCADPYSRRVLRVSMGAPFQLPLVPSKDLAIDLEILRERGQMTLIAAVADAAAEPLTGVQIPNRLAFLLGNERHGLSDQWKVLCDRRVTIPMQRGSDSLNVAVASGIFLHHFCPPDR